MKYKRACISALSFLFCVNFSIAQTDTILSAADLKPYGRSLIDQQKNLELISSAAYFSFSFTGSECTLYAFLNDPAAHSYLQYELDGVYQKRLKVTGDSVQQIKLTANKDGRHTIEIYKATEATTGPIIIQKIAGKNLHSIAPSNEALIEFIGNSITCGADADTSDMPCGKGVYQDYHNAYYAYGPRVARALNTNYILSSVSGIGIYRTWNMDEPSMPQVYEKESFSTKDSMLWNFKTYTPKIVSIALGTNDLSVGDGIHPRQPFDSARFVKDYTSFVELVKSKYPKAIIALLSSPMINGDKRILLQNCLTTVKKNIDALYPSDKKIALYFFDPMKADGCSGHPSVADHAILARKLVPFFKKLLQ
jgi:carbohydrate esterase-like protein/GDSL-like lipase/acylhydrolase family protein